MAYENYLLGVADVMVPINLSSSKYGVLIFLKNRNTKILKVSVWYGPIESEPPKIYRISPRAFCSNS